MRIVYISLTGNVRRFVERLGVDASEVTASNTPTDIDDDYVFIVPTYGDDVNNLVKRFIDHGNNIKRLIGFVGSGNLNFADKYLFSAKELAARYGKPLIYGFEFSGTNNDVENFKKEVSKFGFVF